MYVLMGANGNITSRAVRALLQQGKPVRVIGRSAAALAPLRQLGAEAAVGDAQETSFLTRAFEGATGVYVMIPTDYGAPDMRRSQTQFGTAIATAIARSGVRRVVNLSSVGAELPAGTGPIAGLHEQEQRLNALPGLDLLHLRPGYFMENHLHAAAAIAALGVYPSLERSDVSVPMVATPDIAAVVARELIEPTDARRAPPARATSLHVPASGDRPRQRDRPAGPVARPVRAGTGASCDARGGLFAGCRRADGGDGALAVGRDAHDVAGTGRGDDDDAGGLRSALSGCLRGTAARGGVSAAQS